MMIKTLNDYKSRCDILLQDIIYVGARSSSFTYGNTYSNNSVVGKSVIDLSFTYTLVITNDHGRREVVQGYEFCLVDDYRIYKIQEVLGD